ncbi:MAG: hypothetical protein Q8R13_05535 [bacterium]|nr:hypothetical protein [bacterium]MDZ4296457.1 hypothetical protein [Patescibacteria group bacterium]
MIFTVCRFRDKEGTPSDEDFGTEGLWLYCSEEGGSSDALLQAGYRSDLHDLEELGSFDTDELLDRIADFLMDAQGAPEAAYAPIQTGILQFAAKLKGGKRYRWLSPGWYGPSGDIKESSTEEETGEPAGQGTLTFTVYRFRNKEGVHLEQNDYPLDTKGLWCYCSEDDGCTRPWVEACYDPEIHELEKLGSLDAGKLLAEIVGFIVATEGNPEVLIAPLRDEILQFAAKLKGDERYSLLTSSDNRGHFILTEFFVGDEADETKQQS